jgi:hypothetical protein
MQSLSHRDAALQQEGADLVDNAGTLTDQSLAHPMQGLEIKLVRRLGRDELHGRALHRLGDRFGIAIVVLFTFGIRPHVFRRHQPGVVAERLKFATEMMSPGAGLHADQARRQVDKPRFHLATRPLLAQHHGSTPILANDVERILADIDADHGDFAVEFLGHRVLLCLRCPLASLAR